jgi:hypothetical protein
MTPAVPTRMRLVRAAMAETRISGAEPTIVSDPWCSLTQKRE